MTSLVKENFMFKLLILSICSFFMFSCASPKLKDGHHVRKPQSNEEEKEEKKLIEHRRNSAIRNSIHAQ